jgi:hypothetical protein
MAISGGVLVGLLLADTSIVSPWMRSQRARKRTEDSTTLSE